MSTAAIRFPCHPGSSPILRRGWAICAVCGTRLRRGESRAPLYDARYPAERGHHDPAVGECKVRSLDRWLARLGIDPAVETVCEIGFGGGFCLAELQRRGARVMGLEPVAENRAHAAALGVPAQHLFGIEPDPALSFPPTLWLFQDSFEHLDDPGSMLRWLGRVSSPAGARVLVVAPDAGSMSRRLLGPLWPHNSADHRIHYTRAGIEALFGREGFRSVRAFHPSKCLSPAIIIRHLGVLCGRRAPAGQGPDRWRLWFNIGEMGLLLSRDAHRP